MKYAIIYLLGILLISQSNISDAQVYHTRFTKKVCVQNQCQVISECGTSVCIGKDENGNWILLTAGHGAQNASAVDIALPDKNGSAKWNRVSTIYASSESNLDLGILRANSQYRLKCSSIYKGNQLALHSPLECAGYPQGKSFRRWKSRLVSRRTLQGKNDFGESGGPVYFKQEVIGIQWGHDPRENITYFTPREQIVNVLSLHVPRLVSCRNMLVVQEDSSHYSASLKIDNEAILKLEQRLEIISHEIKTLGNQIQAIEKKDGKISDRLQGIEEDLSKLRPLLKRRIILKTESGKTTADRVYAPKEPIILQSQIKQVGPNP